ncbi:MAG: hypothetical protein BWY75_03071 [bacterium ADurb.Bin425]|nr:MAG: hypothetical protein BWY75_03071 [bacterium ADurb.Bin425]
MGTKQTGGYAVSQQKQPAKDSRNNHLAQTITLLKPFKADEHTGKNGHHCDPEKGHGEATAPCL